MNKNETAACLALLAAAYPTNTVSQETAMVYHAVLGNLDSVDVLKAAQMLIATEYWFPSPAAILRQVAANDGTLAPAAIEAWAETLVQVRVVGRMGTPIFGHPTIDQAVKSLGWNNICMSENIDILRGQFLRAYGGMADAHDNAILRGMSALVRDFGGSVALAEPTRGLTSHRGLGRG